MKLRLFAILSFAATVITASNADAAISVLQSQSLPRLDASGNAIPKRPPGLTPEGISRSDCDDDQKIRFPLQLSGFEAAGQLEAWASVDGIDCAASASRTGPTQACWLLAALPLQPNPVADLRVRELISGAPPFAAAAPSSAPCGAVDLTAISVQFLYFAPGLETATEGVTVRLRADTVPHAPLAPPIVEPAEAGTQLRVSSAPSLTEGQVLTSENVYCAKNIQKPECSSASFGIVSGTVPDAAFDTEFLCGRLTGSTRSIDVARAEGEPLVSGTDYVFVTASTDVFGNVSALSAPSCATASTTSLTPEGGGACSTSRPAGSFPTGLALLTAAAVAVARRRRGLFAPS